MVVVTNRIPVAQAQGHDGSRARLRSLMRALGCGLALVLVSGCRYVDTLEPTFAWMYDAGVCGGHVLIDGRSGLWRESGCENGRPLARRARRLSKAEQAAVAEVMATLPRDRGTLTWAEYQRFRAVFGPLGAFEHPCHVPAFVSAREPDGTQREWAVQTCEPRGSEGRVDDASFCPGSSRREVEVCGECIDDRPQCGDTQCDPGFECMVDVMGREADGRPRLGPPRCVCADGNC